MGVDLVPQRMKPSSRIGLGRRAHPLPRVHRQQPRTTADPVYAGNHARLAPGVLRADRRTPSQAPATRLPTTYPASAGLVLALAGGVRKAGGVLARWAGFSVVDEVVGDYRLPGDLQPPAFPLVGRLRWLLGAEQFVPAEWAAAVLPGEQAQRVAIQRGFDASAPGGPVLGQGGVVGRRPTGDRGVPDDRSRKT